MSRTSSPVRTVRALAAAAGAALATGASGGVAGRLNDLMFPVRAATFSGPNDRVMWFVFWVSAFFFAVLMIAMVVFAIRYRRRPGVAQQRSPAHNLPLELTWSGIPLILCVVMFAWGLKIYTNMLVPPGRAETISVTAKKWSWTWDYPGGGQSLETTKDFGVIAEAPVFAVPVGRPVKLMMHSEDVIHSLFIPVFRKKIDVMPNRYTSYWFEATEPGDFKLFCAEYCGDQHSQMLAMVKVMPEAEYQDWLAKQRNTDQVELLELAQKLYITKGCNACHTLDGSAGTGPSWKDAYKAQVPLASGGTVTADENYLRQSILDPGSQIHSPYANQMPVFAGKLTDRELNALVTYIMSLSASGAGEAEEKVKQDDAWREERRAAQEAGTQAMAAPKPAGGN